MNSNTLHTPILQILSKIVGDKYVLSDEYSCSFYAQDIYTKSIPALAVIQPATSKELSKVINKATSAGYITIPRGGGMSYTSGFVPNSANTIMIDMSRMNKVIEINKQDMYVTVECGCTWKDLYEALKPTGLRTPFWGTLSGIYATVGGGLSQNGMFWGSGQYGAIADSVIAMDVIISDGSLIKTGADAQVNGSPFFRHFGPDTTGIFVGDTGALGFKVNATFKLIPELPAKEYIAVSFNSANETFNAMSEISRKGLAMESFAFDPYLKEQRMKRESLATDAKNLIGYIKSESEKSISSAIKQGTMLALKGRNYMENVDYSLQIIIEEKCPEAAALALIEVRTIINENNGKEISNTIPKVLRSNPFPPVNNMVGPNGERWVCVHGLFPHSKVSMVHEKTQAIIRKHKLDMNKHNIVIGYLFATISTHAFVIEPVFFWQDELKELHEKSVTPSHFANLKKFPENIEARDMVDLIKNEMSQLYSSLGGSHFQIGKTYHYSDGMQTNTLDLIKSIKQHVDPKNLMNPGALGL